MKKLKRVLYIGHRTDLTGPEFSMLHLLEWLDRERFEPMMACQGKGAFYEEARRLGVKTFIVPMPLTRFPHSLAARLVWLPAFLFRFLVAVLRLVRIILRERIAIVHTNVSVNLCGATAARLAGRKSVIHLREMYKGKTPRRRYLKILRALSHELVAVSKAVAGQWPGEKIPVAHNGVPLSRFERRDGYRKRREMGLEPEEYVVGVFGRVHPRKGLSEFFSAALPLFVQFPHFRVAVAGAPADGGEAYLAEIKRWLFKEGASSRALFLGFRDDVPDLMSAMDAVAVPSVDPDSLPRVVMEAMASGKPVIGSRTGGIPEMIEDGKTGFLAEPGDEKRWQEALTLLLEDRSRSLRMGRNALEAARERFGIEGHVRAIQEIYERL